jgi:cardiolipin synthase
MSSDPFSTFLKQCTAGGADPLAFSGNAVEVIVDGPAAYDVMLEAISQARHHVHLEMYIYRSVAEGEAGQKFAQALIDKAAQGVEVCLLYDPAGSRRTPHSFFTDLRQRGVQVLEHNPVNPWRIRGAWRPNRRDHRKMLVVDGRLAVIGGIDISRHYDKRTYEAVRRGELDPAKGGWHDVDVRIEGPAVAALQQVFLDTWHRQKGSPLKGAYFPSLGEQGRHPVRVLRAGAGTKKNGIHTAYLNGIEHARSSIHIANAYFMPDEQIEEALCRAARRGVEVQLLLPGVSDFKIVIYAQRYHYEALRVDDNLENQMLHAKIAVIDRCWCMVGSYNLDVRSWLHAEEVNALIVHPECARPLEAMFESDLRRAQRIRAEEWQSRSRLHRFVQRLVHQFQYWL